MPAVTGNERQNSNLGVERGVDLVEEVEGGGVCSLNGEDERERHQRLLAARQLLQRHRVPGSERHLSVTLTVTDCSGCIA